MNNSLIEEDVLFGDLSEAATVTIWNSVMVLCEGNIIFMDVN